MRVDYRLGLSLFMFCGACSTFAADQEADSDQTSASEISQLRSRVDNLERQLAATSTPAPSSTSTRTGNDFNPAIGVVFQGQAWHYGEDTDGYAIAGFPFGGEAGPVDAGLALGETEIDISANVDDKFTAWLTVPIVMENGDGAVEIEEAWIETTALPAGLSARLGRFFSGVGYLNNKHAHAWDFVDQPLPYQALLGDQYLDDGVQLRWLAPTDVYLEFAAEVLRGDRYPASGAGRNGHGSYSYFVNIGGDVGVSNSWLGGISYLSTSSSERASGDEDNPLRFDGDTSTVIVHGVWKWAPNGNWKQRNAIVQAEYIAQNNDGNYALPGGPVLPYDNDQQGWYLQGVYQPFPHWRLGMRFAQLSSDDASVMFFGTALAAPATDPKRYTLMVDWSNSEFSRLRLQYTRDQAGPVDDNQWGLQYIFSIGAHGAHTF